MTEAQRDIKRKLTVFIMSNKPVIFPKPAATSVFPAKSTIAGKDVMTDMEIKDL